MNVLKRLWYQVRLTRRLLEDKRVVWWKKVIPVVGLVYVLSPLDLIPDFIVGLGQLDDVGIVLLTLRMFEKACPPEIVAEHRAVLDGKTRDGMIVQGYENAAEQ
jgi:uncharacterized membrane protein YkvA (DUF1232 family)